MYRLNQNVQPNGSNGWCMLKKCIFFHRDINEVKKLFVKQSVKVFRLNN